MGARVYKLINGSEREALLSLLNTGIGRWAQEYAAGDPATRCTLLLAEDKGVNLAGVRQWIQGTRPSGPGPVLAIGLAEDWERQLAGLVLGERQAAVLDSAGARLIRGLSSELFAELGQSVLEALLPKKKEEGGVSWAFLEGEPALDARTGDPLVLCDCRIGDRLSMLIALSPRSVLECLASVAAPSAGRVQLEPRARALQSETVVLEAIVGEAEIAVEDLGSLSVGDVIKLNRKIHQPVQVSVRGGGAVCAARLGLLKGRTALQLT